MSRPSAIEGFPSSGLVPLSQDPVEIPFESGQIIAGKYEVIGLLGSGGMGYVISARHVELGEMVALKFLRPEALVHPELVERFAREARAAAKIRCEHIARVFDVGSLPGGVPFIVMEHLDGKDLADLLHQEGPLPIEVAVDYIMQTCEALAAAHACGIVHRDIKPENLFLTRHGQGIGIIKILDFGISKVALAKGKRDLVRTQMALGSPVYMSPEHIRSHEEVDARSDIWAVGCVLFELITGVTAFDEPSLLQLSAAILERDPVPLQTLRPDASLELELVVLRCLEKDPANRYQNVAELAAALYPFAPRRARISAERCYHMLKSAGLVATELQLASAFPPAMSERRISTATLASQRTTTPAAIDIEVGDRVSATAPQRSKKLVWLGLGAVAAVGVFLAARAQHTGEPTRPQAATAATAAAPLVAKPVAAPPSVVEPGAARAGSELPSGDASSRSSAATASRAASALRPGKLTVPKAPPRPVRPLPKRPRAQESDELDPGF